MRLRNLCAGISIYTKTIREDTDKSIFKVSRLPFELGLWKPFRRLIGILEEPMMNGILLPLAVYRELAIIIA